MPLYMIHFAYTRKPRPRSPGYQRTAASFLGN
jgi:hypothetical protein